MNQSELKEVIKEYLKENLEVELQEDLYSHFSCTHCVVYLEGEEIYKSCGHITAGED